jgi:hypothetical protein
MNRQRDDGILQLEHAAMMTLRKRFRMSDAGAGKYDALCPAHDDHSKSLRVYRVDGRLYFRCYAGCGFNDVRRELGLPVFTATGASPYATEWRPTPARREPKSTRYNYGELADQFAADGTTLAPLAAELGVSLASLLDADVGRVDGHPMYSRKIVAKTDGARSHVPVHAWAWPMVDGALGVIGLRLRTFKEPGRDVAKFSWTDSTPGLFFGRRWIGGDAPLLVVEGPTDRAAAFDWGFDAVGKPSCNDGDDLLVEFLNTIKRATGRRRDVVILSQLDPAMPKSGGGVFHPGQDGSVKTSRAIFYAARSVRIITPPGPVGVVDDARKWLHAGGTRADVDRAIASKKPVRRNAQ